MLRILLLLTLLAGLAAPAARAAPVRIEDDQFSPFATIEGPVQSVNPFFADTSRSWFLRSFVNKSDLTVRHQLYVETSYSTYRRGWNQATDDNAQPHKVVKIALQHERCPRETPCDYFETVGVDLDDRFVRARAATGFELKLVAKSGDYLILTVSPAQIEPVLLAVDAYVKAAGAPAAAPPAVAPKPTVDPPGAPAPRRCRLSTPTDPDALTC